MKKIKLAVGYGHSGSLIFAGPGSGSHRAMELEWAVRMPAYPCAYQHQKKDHLPKEKKILFVF